MATQSNLETPLEFDPKSVRRAPAPLPRLWPPVALLALYWPLYFVWRYTEFGIRLGFFGFLIMAGITLVTTLLFAGWWLGLSRVRWSERFWVLGMAVVALVAAAVLSDKTLGPVLLFPGLPLVLTISTLAIALFRKLPSPLRCRAVMGVVCVSWFSFTLLRAQGMEGDGGMDIHWRWSLSPEQEYLAGLKPQEKASIKSRPGGVAENPDDWTGFRGRNRDATLRDVRIKNDWNTAPPFVFWRRRIGPAWSSVAIVGDRLYTQEQVGDQEAVVCLDATVGRTIWSHQDHERHDDVQGSAGPRATPTFAEQRIFALGATGTLNCLDAAYGDLRWSRNIATDAGAKKPMWGFSSSPLVVGNLVIVYAGETDKALLAYRIDTGEIAWTASAGKISYSSPQLVTIRGVPQILMNTDHGLSSFDPSSGALLWEHLTEAGNPGVPRSIQPRVVDQSRVLFDAGPDTGTILLDVTHDSGQWVATEKWVSQQLKPYFNDFVVHGNAIFGFDARFMICVDLETGRQRWKDGRYGYGQVLLLEDQPLLLVVTDKGEVVLVAADPNKHQELARFKAIEGKTWNHPVIAHGHLYVRNAEEIACYRLSNEMANP